MNNKNTRDVANILKIISIFFGTVMGAGFTSGREIYVYFARFGLVGLLMTILAGIGFFYLGVIFLNLGAKCKAKSITQYMELLFGKASKFFEILIIFSYVIVLGAMFAGFDSLQKILNLPFLNGYPFIGVVSAILCCIIVLGGVKNLSKLNFAIIPLLLIFMCVIFCVALYKPEQSMIYLLDFKPNFTMPLFSSIIFICSNMFLTGFILLNAGENSSKRVNFYASFWTAFIITIIAGLTGLCILLNPTCIQYDMPFVFLSHKVSDGFVLLSVVILWFAIFTTAVATMFTISWWLQTYIKNGVICATLTCVVSFLLSRMGFNKIVDVLYPLTGVMDILFIIATLILYFRINYKISNNYCERGTVVKTTFKRLKFFKK